MKVIAVCAFFICWAALFTGHVVYVHVTEYRPAKQEWIEAHNAHNLDGELAALDKQLLAMEHAADPFWMFRTN